MFTGFLIVFNEKACPINRVENVYVLGLFIGSCEWKVFSTRFTLTRVIQDRGLDGNCLMRFDRVVDFTRLVQLVYFDGYDGC